MDKDTKIQTKLNLAVAARQFEVEHFWKRSLFYWGFIAAAFVAFGSLYKKEEPQVALVVACFGFVCSVAWTLANRGSKYWQDSWAQKVKREEIALFEAPFFWKQEEILEKEWWLQARKFSVSKLAIALSDFTTAVWLLLIFWIAVGSDAGIGYPIRILLPLISIVFAVLMGKFASGSTLTFVSRV